MKKINISILTILLALFLSLQVDTIGGEKGDRKSNKPSLSKASVNPAQSLMNINNITSWVGQDGFHDWVVASSYNGAFPKGASVGAIFAEGIVWGGKVSDGGSQLIRVNGNTYGTGAAPLTRVFRVRPDYVSGDLSSDAASFFDKPLGAVTESDIQTIRDQYALDWQEWPAEEGALYKDVNEDGQYDPSIDIPGIPGAAQTLYIKYDDSKSASNYGSIPIGLEVSETYWAYAYSGALGNVIYKKVDIIYKGTPTSAANSKIDSMFIVQWADPDLGNAGDDFAGCDTTLNLGYTYNSSAVDATYESAGFVPPSVGYDFLQGVSQFTGNPADSAIFNLKWRKGYKYVNPKPMSSFAYFAAGGTWSDPGFDYDGTLEFYNLMRGKLPIPRYPNGENFPEAAATTTPFGTYLVPGDPVAGTGKIDGSVDTPGDRRLMVTNGPISMSLGDTAQVVVALVGAFGSDYLNSVTQLKQNDETAQIVFDQLFQLPSIEPPVVKVAPLHNSVVLNWGNNQQSVETIENFEDQNYTFEGYLLYQLPSASSSPEDGVLLANFDLVNGVTAVYDTTTDKFGTANPELVVPGTDNGIKRFFHITDDAVRGGSLRDGQTYYFSVVSYAVNPAPLLPFHALKSSAVTLSVTPQQPDPGVRYGSVVGDTLLASHDTGTSDGFVVPLVVDPTKTTGNDYKVTFENVEGSFLWSLTNVTDNKVVLANQSNQSGDDNYPIVDGLIVKVVGPDVAINDWSAAGTRWFSGTNWGGSQFFGGMDLGANFFGSDVDVTDYVPVQLVWTGGAGKETPSVENGWSQGAVYLRSDGYSYQGAGWMPFQAFDVSNPDNPVQVNVSFVEDANDGSANMQWDMGWDGSGFKDNGGREYIFISKTAYDPNYYGTDPDGTFNDVLYAIWPSSRGSHPYLEAPFTFDIIPNYANTDGDVFTFSAPSVTNDPNLAKADVDKVNVFPNPYYGTHGRETSRSNHYVTFNHLPDNAIIRIFDLSGVLVKTINHIETSGQFDTWDLRNENGLPVASGIYIVYVDMPKLGKSKILKLAVVQEEQILQIY